MGFTCFFFYNVSLSCTPNKTWLTCYPFSPYWLHHVLYTDLSTVLPIILSTILYTSLSLTSEPSSYFEHPFIPSKYSVSSTFIPATPFYITNYKPIYPLFSPSFYPCSLRQTISPFCFLVVYAWTTHFSHPVHPLLPSYIVFSRCTLSFVFFIQTIVPCHHYVVPFNIIRRSSTMFTTEPLVVLCPPLFHWLPLLRDPFISISCYRHSLPHTHLVLSSRPPISASIHHTQSNSLRHDNVHLYRSSQFNKHPRIPTTITHHHMLYSFSFHISIFICISLSIPTHNISFYLTTYLSVVSLHYISLV